METVKYQYAINSTGRTINVDNLIASSEVRREQFKCISCDNLLVPVLGEKRRKHFRHKADIECSPETYLHKLAKLKFYEIYNTCLQEHQPFWIEISFTKYCSFYEEEFLVPCIFSKGKHKFDLTQYFKDIKLEPKDGSFIPDLLLSNEKGEKIFVEIAVTHKSTLEKRQSEQRIIEININNEHDIKLINDRLLSENDKIDFWNFRREQTKDFCHGICIHKLKSKVNSHKNIDNNASLLLFLYKNCFFCRHHRIIVHKEKDIPIYCQFFKQRFHAKEANNCPHYLPDDKFIHNLHLV
ncbi:competence protein CoiA family protein [Anabaena lutea]|uniref:Competence protein CoiA-like family protein n=1 Tax=Anabaena lutea FACHB-196 TaxID=2692881 RepID=A0ABR8FET7_9NOST|nr:competence protein CoiA family protein [Anabaena lutea]MBD2568519.1 hypothetical protein [Anabaena lutea FACHB-196]